MIYRSPIVAVFERQRILQGTTVPRDVHNEAHDTSALVPSDSAKSLQSGRHAPQNVLTIA